MKANQGAIVLIDKAADHGRLRSVLHEWGYTETEIQRFLNENAMDAPTYRTPRMSKCMQVSIRGQALPHE